MIGASMVWILVYDVWSIARFEGNCKWEAMEILPQLPKDHLRRRHQCPALNSDPRMDDFL